MSKNDEFCIINEELCITNDEFRRPRTKCTRKDATEKWRRRCDFYYMDSHSRMVDFALKSWISHSRLMDLHQEWLILYPKWWIMCHAPRSSPRSRKRRSRCRKCASDSCCGRCIVLHINEDSPTENEDSWMKQMKILPLKNEDSGRCW